MFSSTCQFQAQLLSRAQRSKSLNLTQEWRQLISESAVAKTRGTWSGRADERDWQLATPFCTLSPEYRSWLRQSKHCPFDSVWRMTLFIGQRRATIWKQVSNTTAANYGVNKCHSWAFCTNPYNPLWIFFLTWLPILDLSGPLVTSQRVSSVTLTWFCSGWVD